MVTDALDDAFLSRSDAAIHVPLPDRDGLRKILSSTLSALGDEYPGLRTLAESAGLATVAARAVGLDGRRARKVVFEALSLRIETVLDPARLTDRDLVAAIDRAIEQIDNNDDVEQADAAA